MNTSYRTQQRAETAAIVTALSFSLVAVILLLMVLGSIGCATAPLRHTATASTELSKCVKRLQIDIEASYREGMLDRATRDEWQLAFLQIGTAGLALDKALIAMDTPAVTKQIGVMLDLVDDLLQTQVLRLPERVEMWVRIALESIRSILITLSVSAEATA